MNVIATEWKSQQGDGKYALQFNTDDRDLYKLVEKACQLAMDQAELHKLRKQKQADTLKREVLCGTCENNGWDMPQCMGECQRQDFKWYRKEKG